MVSAGHAFAITTPLCLAESPAASGTRAAALPGPKLARTLTLVARRQELGTLPKDLAVTCRNALAQMVLPDLRRLMPVSGDALYVVT
jgi:hypothetical protein